MGTSKNVIQGHVKNMTNIKGKFDAIIRESNISLASLRAFVAVVEEMNFSLAAQRLGVTQPGISVQLASLERTCGFILCTRKPQIALTVEGRSMFVKARLILEQVRDFENHIEALHDSMDWRIRIGMSAPYAALPMIARYLDKFPDVDLKCHLGNTTSLLEDVAHCRIDVGVMALREPIVTLACKLLTTPLLVACVPKNDPIAKMKKVRVKDLASRSFVLREKGSLTRQLLEATFETESQTLLNRFVLSSREAVKEAVAAGLGITVLFEGEEGNDSRFATVPFQSQPKGVGVFAVALKESLALPSIREFMNS